MTLSIPEVVPDDPLKAALAYAAAGWYVLPVDPTSKHAGSLTGSGWDLKSTRDPAQLTRWFTGQPDAALYRTVPRPALALHVGRSGAVAFDVDYPAQMPDVLREVITSVAPPFQNSNPSTPERGHYLFAAEPGSVGNSVGDLGKGWGEVRGLNGIIIVAPTPHSVPGHAYHWLRTGPLPCLPGALAACLRPPGASGHVDDAAVRAFRDGLPGGLPCDAVARCLDDFPDTGRHDEMISRTLRLARLGEQGHHGVAETLDALQELFVAAVADRAGDEEAEGEYISALDGAIATVLSSPTPDTERGCCDNNWLAEAGFDVEKIQQRIMVAVAHQAPAASATSPVSVTAPEAPTPDTEDFWSARPELEIIRRFARARMVSPWAVLGCVLTRIACEVPPTVVLPPLRGGEASLNLFAALVGESSAGKGAAVKVAASAVYMGMIPSYTMHKLGSGNGIAHGFVSNSAKEGRVQHTRSCLFIVDEIDYLAGNAAMTGTTLLAELKAGWMGEQLGALYADPSRRVEVREHEYRMGLVVGVQPTHASLLLSDVDGGTPQRFLWLPAGDPQAPDVPPDEPDPMPWPEPVWPHLSRPTASPLLATGQVSPAALASPPVAYMGKVKHYRLPVCDRAVADVRAQALVELRNPGRNTINGHRLLARLKVAALLDILHGLTEVTDDGWTLAETLMQVSDTTRAGVVAVLHDQETARHRTRAGWAATEAVYVDDARDRAALARVKANVASKLTDAWQGARVVKRQIAQRDRDRVDEALTALVTEGVAETQERTHAGTAGHQYRRAKV